MNNITFTITGRKADRGFTLIELLVVIAIISLLVAILIPSLNKAKELARQVACQVQVRGIITGMLAYGSEYDGLLPRPWGYGPNSVLDDNGNPSPALGYLFSSEYSDGSASLAALCTAEYAQKELFWCPADSFRDMKVDPRRCSYDYRIDPPPAQTVYLKEAGISSFFEYRMDTTYDKNRVALISDAFTTNWHNWICSHNYTADLGLPEDMSVNGDTVASPSGFNVGFLDGGVTWLDFEYGELPWSGAYTPWSSSSIRFFLNLDGCNQ